MPTPPNYQGLYSNGGGYGIGDIVLTDGNPYGSVGVYYIRVSDPGNTGYPPGNARWEIYNMPKSIGGPGSIAGPGNIS
jgi:hypothetical protein